MEFDVLTTYGSWKQGQKYESETTEGHFFAGEMKKYHGGAKRPVQIATS